MFFFKTKKYQTYLILYKKIIGKQDLKLYVTYSQVLRIIDHCDFCQCTLCVTLKGQQIRLS